MTDKKSANDTKAKERVKFTAGRVDDYECEPGKSQSFLWDTEAPGLGLRATANGAKSYIFQAKLNGQAIRIKIGSPKTWPIEAEKDENGKTTREGARQEARRLKTIIDNGRDPRQVDADVLDNEQAARDAKEAEKTAIQAQQARESITLGMAWPEYIKAQKPFWGELHLRDHIRAMHAGGEKRKRSPKLTEPGTLASLADVRLTDLTKEKIIEWVKAEAAKRPTRARNARMLLGTFLNWCSKQLTYQSIITTNAARDDDVKKHLGKPNAKTDALQKEQLSTWFTAVKQIGNPVISAYVQALFLTGARPNELISIQWEDVDFKWNSMTIKDKVEGLRVIPLTPYVAHLLSTLPRRNQWVFSSTTAKSGRLTEPRIAHNKACAIAVLNVTLHGLRRSFANMCEWIEVPFGIGSQIQGHKPQGTRETHYINRPLDLLRMWHVKIEAWILEQAGIKFVPVQAGLRVAV